MYQQIQRQTFGWTIVVGSVIDVFSDLVVNNRTLSTIGGVITIHRYGFILFYGIGFGFPYLLGIPTPYLSCSSDDYLEALKLFGVTLPLVSSKRHSISASSVFFVLALGRPGDALEVDVLSLVSWRRP
jgi:hypothetical protein